jgi:hypothetical protein
MSIDSHLVLLKNLLNFKLPLSVIAVGYVLMISPAGVFIVIDVLTIAAVLFTPYMLFVLKKEKHAGWIYFFIIMVILPLIAVSIIYYSGTPFMKALIYIPLALYYLYCFLLRFSVNGWIDDLHESLLAKERYDYERGKREEETKAFLKQFEK